MSYLCGIGSYMCGFPTPKKAPAPNNEVVNAIPKEITEKEIHAAFGATNHTEINQRSPIEKNSIKNPDGIEILKAFGAII
jgi:hypothetical protein